MTMSPVRTHFLGNFLIPMIIARRPKRYITKMNREATMGNAHAMTTPK